ncbi:MAG: hypothetical protein K5679_09010 [Lachnospiraceae bacterium]|nr:hypothetical protein [Lachnospiraceae bacterium]
MRNILKRAAISAGIILVGIIGGYLLLVLAFCIDIPEEKYQATMQILAEEGYHPRELLRTGKSDYYAENYPDILDIGTDEYIFKHSLRNTEENSFQRAFIIDYGRYWHGYVIFLRPLSILFELDEIRYINLGVQLILFLLFCFGIYLKTQKLRYPVVALFVYFILGPNSLACNMQYSSIYYVAIISGIVAIFFHQYFEKSNRYIYLLLVSGMATVYVDYLTYPLLAWCVPATIVIALYKETRIANKTENIWLSKVWQLAITAIMWIVGYSFMWAGKWILTLLISGNNRALRTARKEMKFILGTHESHFITRLQSFFKNWNHLTYKPITLILILFFLVWIIVIVRKGVAKDYRIPAFAVMIFAAPAWCFIAYSHTWAHHIFTWRVTLTIVIAAMMIVCLTTEYSDGKEVISLKSGLFRAFACIACITLGLITYRLIPAEKQSNWNYNVAHEERVIPAGEENGYVMDFIPMYSHICSVDPVINSDDYAGYTELILSDGNKVIDTQKISFDGTEESNIKALPVNWHLKKGNRYQITISTKNMKGNVRTWVTDDTSQYEFDGEEAMGMGYTYYIHFVDKKAALFFVMSWSVAWMIVGYLILFFRRTKKLKGEIINE